ncbi:MAG TPA: hypothetical protein VKM36_10850 [Balneolaceae bacterium]|nr:hypothetical protein [Balneolaceae bacterium]
MKENRNNIFIWLVNPFRFWGGSKLLTAGILVLLLHIPVGYFFGARFDGAIDMHISFDVSLLQVTTDVIIAWLSMALSFFVVAKLLNAPARFIDVAGATAVARIPLLLSVFPGYLFVPNAATVEEILALEGSDLYLLVAGSVILMVFVIWFFIVLFNAFKINTNLKRWKLATGFLLGVIVAEIVSLLLIRQVLEGIL